MSSSVPQHRAHHIYDQLIEDAVRDDASPESHVPGSSADRGADVSPPATSSTQPDLSEHVARRRAFLLRVVALLAACWFSVGSHYAQYLLGPIKSRLLRELGSNHTEFSLLLAAYSLNSSWTPLVGGILASRLGTTLTSIVATGLLFVGQALLLLGDVLQNIRLMAFGMFIFGLGVTPLAVVQETIIVRFFHRHGGLGTGMALGLVVGKMASFAAARTSWPLSEHFGSRAPFVVATTLTGTSVIVNILYIFASKYLVEESGAELEAPDLEEEAKRRRTGRLLSEAEVLEKVAQKKKVRLAEVPGLGDVLWTYVGLNVFCGMIWHPFAHLAANMVEKRYGLTERAASIQASYLLFGPFFLYPACGFIVDKVKNRHIIVYLLLGSSALTLLCYSWLALPPSLTQTAWPAIAFYGFGQAYAPLLLVLIVPKIVSLKYVSTALGLHKCLETSGTTIFQTTAGLILDTAKGKPTETGAYQQVINAFWVANVCQMAAILGLWYLHLHKKEDHPRTSLVQESSSVEHRPDDGAPDERRPLLSTQVERSASSSAYPSQSQGSWIASRIWRGGRGMEEAPERRRGKIFAGGYLGVVIVNWTLFLGTAWLKL